MYSSQSMISRSIGRVTVTAGGGGACGAAGFSHPDIQTIAANKKQAWELLNTSTPGVISMGRCAIGVGFYAFPAAAQRLVQRDQIRRDRLLALGKLVLRLI